MGQEVFVHTSCPTSFIRVIMPKQPRAKPCRWTIVFYDGLRYFWIGGWDTKFQAVRMATNATAYAIRKGSPNRFYAMPVTECI